MSKDPLYGDDPRQTPPEETPVIKNRFATDPGLIDFSTAGELEFKKQKRRKEMVDSDLPYSKTPEELESSIEDSQLQRKKWELASMLSQKKSEIEATLISIPENTGNPEENAYNLVEKNKLISTLVGTQKQLEELKPDSFEEQKSTLEYVIQPIQDTYDVWKEVLQTGNIWEPISKRTKEARENFKELGLAFFKGSTGILASSLQGIAILGNAWDRALNLKPYTDGEGNYSNELEDSPIFRLGKYLSEQTAPVGDESLLTDLMRAQGSMAGFILGGELLAPIKGIAPTNQLLQQVFSRMGNVAITGGFAQYPEEYLKALELTKDQSKALWVGALNFVGGMSEALPIEAFLEKLTASTGIKFLWQKALKDASIQGTEEGLQEMFQQLLANATAQQIYDANRELLEGVAKGGAIGFLSGMLLSGTIGLKQVVKEYEENTELAKKFNELHKEAYERAYGNLSEFTKYATQKIEQMQSDNIKRNASLVDESQQVEEYYNSLLEEEKDYEEFIKNEKLNEVQLTALEEAEKEFNETPLDQIRPYDPESDEVDNFIDKLIFPKKKYVSRNLKNKNRLSDTFNFVFPGNIFYGAKNKRYRPSGKLQDVPVTDPFLFHDHFEQHGFESTIDKIRINLEKALNEVADEREYIVDEIEKFKQESKSIYEKGIDYKKRKQEGKIENDESDPFINFSKRSKTKQKLLLSLSASNKKANRIRYYLNALSNPKSLSKIREYVEYQSKRKLDFINEVVNPLREQVSQYIKNLEDKLAEQVSLLDEETLNSNDIPQVRIDKKLIKDNAKKILDILNKKRFEFYHGAGVVFDRFDRNFINSGEGAQVYGWGHYLTSSKIGIAKNFYATQRKARTGKGVVYSTKVFQKKLQTNSSVNLIKFEKPLSIYQYTLLRNGLLDIGAKGLVAKLDSIYGIDNFSPPKFYDLFLNLINDDFTSEQKEISNLLSKADEILNYEENLSLDSLPKLLSEGRKLINSLKYTSEKSKRLFTQVEDYFRRANYKSNETLSLGQDARWSSIRGMIDEYISGSHSYGGNSKDLSDFLHSLGFDGIIYDANSTNEHYNLVVFDDEDITIEKEKTYFFLKGDEELSNLQSNEVKSVNESLDEVISTSKNEFEKSLAKAFKDRVNENISFKNLDVFGRIDPLTKEIEIHSGLDQNNKNQSVLHEVTHRFTINGIALDEAFRAKIKNIYDIVSSQITLAPEISEMSSEEGKLIEFVGYAFSNPDFQGQLAQIRVGKTGKSAWSEFIHSIWNYLKDKLGFTAEEFSESALNNLVVAVSEYVDQNFPTNQDKIYKEKVVESNLKELQSPTEEFVTNEVPLRDDTAGGVDYKFDNLREVDNEKVWKGMSSSKIVNEFTDKNGKQFYISAEQMYADLLDIYRMAQNRIKEGNPSNLGKDEIALEIFKAKYENEALQREVKKEDANKFSYIENVFLSMKNKRVHKIVTLRLEGGKIELVNHNSVYPTSDKKQTSVIYDKRFYEVINEQVSKVLGKKVELAELKNHKAFLKDYNKGKFGEEQYDESDLMTEVYKKGYALMPNKSEMLLVKIDSILTPEELKTALNIPDVKPTTDGQKVSTYIFNKYWTIAFNPTLNPEFQPSQAALMKRMANLQGKAPNTLITPEIRKMLELEKAAMRIDGDKVMVRTVELDAKKLPDYLKNHLKETLGEDWYKDELVGDGAIISLPEVHNMGNIINGVPTKDWGLLSKYKTFESGEQLLKCADQKAFEFSELYKWMRWNRVGKVILSTARKIKSGQPQISWDQITNNVEINENQIYEYDMRQDAFQSSHGEVKTETRGLMSSYVTTMLSSYMSPEVHQALMTHLKNHINQLKTKTLDNLGSLAFIKKEMESFMKSQADLFESQEQQFISKEIANSDKFAAILQSIDYFKQNILSKRIQYTLQHEESYGSLPTLCADLGQIGGFKDFFIKQYLKKNKEASNEEAETEASIYFDKHGFIKPGYCVVDELTFKKLFSNEKGKPEGLKNVIVGCNPPSSLADIRALKVALVIPNGTFEGQVIDTNFLSVNIKQFQALSGKDFDIDKVPILNAERTPELKTLWDFLHKLNPDAELERFAKEFATWNTEDMFKEPENRMDEIEKLVDIPSLKGKIDGPLAHIIKLFGANKDLQNLDITKPSHFIQLAPKLSDNYIGRLYNVRMVYTAMLEVGKPIEFTFSSKKLKKDNVKVSISTNMKKQSYNKGLLYYLTNYTLDWLSDNKLLAFNYDPALLNMILYDVKIDGKVVEKAEIANEAVMEMYNKFLKPSRMLLRRPEVEDKNIKDYAELKSQLLDAYFSLYTGNMVKKNNPFDETTVIKTTRDFFESFMTSKVGALGLQEQDIKNFFSGLKETIIPKDEKDIKAEQEAIKYGTPLSHLAKILNRFHDLGAKVPTFVTETGSIGKFKEENNEGGMAELWLYSNKLRESGLAPSTHYLFNEFFTDYLTRDIMIVRQSKISRDVVISSTGTSVGRDYVIHLEPGDNKVTYRINEWIKKPNPNAKGKVIKEVKKSTSYNTYQEVLDNQGSYRIDDIINNMKNDLVTNDVTGNKYNPFKEFIYSFGSMFMIKGNSGLKNYLRERFFDLYKNVASEIQTLDINDQRLFFKLGTSIYDLENPDQQYLGARYRLVYYRDSKGITNLSDRTNLQIRDISPYMMYLDKAGEVNDQAKQLYGQIIENLIETGLKMYNDKLDKMANGKLLPIYFFNRVLSWPSTKESTKNLKHLIFEVDEVVDRISTIYSDVIKPFQIVEYWNHYAKGKPKISEDQITAEHREFYLQDFAESFVNYKISFEASNPKKSYEAKLEAYKMLELALKNPNMKYDKYSKLSNIYAKTKPAIHAIRSHSARNIPLMPTERIPYCINGFIRYFTPHELAQEFLYTSHRADEPFMASGSMITQNILRRINDGYNDLGKKQKKLYNDLLDALFHSNPDIKYNPAEGEQFLANLAKKDMFDIAEGSDANQSLKDITFNVRGQLVINKTDVYDIASITNTDGTVKWDLKMLTKVAEVIAIKHNMFLNTSSDVRNKQFNAITHRALIGALMQRWIYDYYVENRIRRNMMQIEAIMSTANNLSPALAHTVRSWGNDFLNKNRSMLKQVFEMRKNLKKEGKHYMPHMWDSIDIYKQDLTEYYIREKGLTPEAAKKKVDEEVEAENKESLYTGIPSIKSHVNFKHRDNPDLKRYSKDITTLPDYLSILSLMFRQQSLQMYEELTKEYSQYDNVFSRMNMIRQFSLTKNQSALYRPIQGLDQVSKGDFVMFEFKDKTNRPLKQKRARFVSFKGTKGEVIKGGPGSYVIPQRDKEPESSKIIHGEVLKVKDGKIQVRIFNISPDEQVVETFSAFEIKNLSLLDPIFMSKEVQMYIYKQTGHLTEKTSLIDVFAKLMVGTRNVTLLGLKPYYWLRNKIGSGQIGKSYLSSHWYKEGKKLVKTWTGLTPEQRDGLPDYEKNMWRVIENAGTSIFGDVNEIMGRIGMDLSVQQGLMTPEKYKVAVEMNRKWVALRAELQPIADEINADRSVINGAPRWTDKRAQFIKRIFADGALKEFYAAHELYSIPFNLVNVGGSKNLEINPAVIEAENRTQTVMTIMAWYKATMMDTTYLLTEEEQALADDFLRQKLVSVIKGHVNLIEGKYVQGIDLSFYDTPGWGRFWNQFFHFTNNQQNGLGSTIGSMQDQIVKFGLFNVINSKNEIEYIERVKDMNTGEVVEVKVVQMNAFRQALKVSIRSVIWGLVRGLILAAEGTLIGAALNSTGLSVLKLFTLGAFADSISIPAITGLMNLLTYILQAQLSTAPGDDDDKEWFTNPITGQKVSIKFKKRVLHELLGSSEEEFVLRELKRIEDRPRLAREFPSNEVERLSRNWYRKQMGRKVLESLPFGGVGLSQAYDLLLSIVFTEGDMDQLVEQLIRDLTVTLVPGAPIVLQVSQTLFPTFFYRSDPYLTEIKRAQYRANVETRKNQIAEDLITSKKDTKAQAFKGTPLESKSWKELDEKLTEIDKMPTDEYEFYERLYDIVDDIKIDQKKRQGILTGQEQYKMEKRITNFFSRNWDLFLPEVYNDMVDKFKKEFKIPEDEEPFKVEINEESAPDSNYKDIINSAAREQGLDPLLLHALIIQESGFNKKAQSNKGAKGLTQLTDSTAEAMGVTDVWNPEQNIKGGAKYLRQMIDQFGSIPAGLSAYNQGPGGHERRGIENAPKETKDYVRNIMSMYNNLKKK